MGRLLDIPFGNLYYLVVLYVNFNTAPTSDILEGFFDFVDEIVLYFCCRIIHVHFNPFGINTSLFSVSTLHNNTFTVIAGVTQFVLFFRLFPQPEGQVF